MLHVEFSASVHRQKLAHQIYSAHLMLFDLNAKHQAFTTNFSDTVNSFLNIL
ncbi:hypothetical protein JCM19233_214 [Vibrio astriarenae]|nr:hypothetical protein JCM19233_214 [Vibrio sp. C7]